MYFIFDANMPLRLVKGLELLDQENRSGTIKIKIDHSDKVVKVAATDADIIKYASKVDAIIISEDDDFKRIKSNKALLKSLGVGYVLYRPPKHGARYWEKVQAFIIGWEKLKEKIRTLTKPFVLVINKKGEIFEETL